MSTKQKKTETLEGSDNGLAEKAASLRDYFEESKVELRKVTWPSRGEVKVTAIAVLVLVAVMSVFLGVLDLGLIKIVELILSIGA